MRVPARARRRVAAVLALLLASPAYDAYRLYRISKHTDKEHYDADIR